MSTPKTTTTAAPATQRLRAHRTAEEQQAVRLDLFRHCVIIAFILLLLALMSLLLPGCKTAHRTPHHEQEPRAPRQPVYTWHYID